MGNIVGECCPNKEFNRMHRLSEKIVYDDDDTHERRTKAYTYNSIVHIQSFYRGFMMRKQRKNDECMTFLFSKIKTNSHKQGSLCMKKSQNFDKLRIIKEAGGITESVTEHKNDESMELETRNRDLEEDKDGDVNLSKRNNNSLRCSVSKSELKNSRLNIKSPSNNKLKKLKTPQGFYPEECPGKLLSDVEVEKIKIKDKVLETEKLIGQFIIDEKEVLKFLEDYKYKLKKFQLEYQDGSIYIGYVDPNWEREGYGIFLLTDGSKYEGTFRKNKMSGRGRLIGAKGDYYEGEFEDDKASGFGKYVNKDGGIYIGYWKYDKQDGRGEELFADGSQYEGFYENGLKHGKGKFTWTDGSIYEGDFNRNIIEGVGTYRWRDGRIFKGEWKFNKMEGNGIFVWPDKKKYIGQYKNDKKSGFGIFIWPGGKKYEGEWLEGKQHGFGVLTFSNVRKCGIWKEGQKEHWINSSECMEQFRTISQEIKKLTERIQFCYSFYRSEDSSPASEASNI